MSDQRFLGIRMLTWNGLAGLSAVVGLFGLLMAGTLGIMEYRDRKKAAQASETLKMIEIWELRGAQDAYLSILTELRTLLETEREGIEANPERFKTIKRNIARRALRNAEAGAYEIVVQYFTRLSLCVRTEICSSDVAHAFFFDTIVDFRDWFDEEINRHRELDARHAIELDRLICQMQLENIDQRIRFLDLKCLKTPLA